jgi:uncharacterized membrane protein
MAFGGVMDSLLRMWPDSLPPALGNLHLLLLHLPVGFVVAAVLLEWWTRRDDAGRRVVEKLLAANAFFAILTAAAGLVLAEQGDYPELALGRHRWAGVICAVLGVLAWWLRARRGVAAGRVGMALALAATVTAGHLGATLTHGDELFAWSSPAAAPVVVVDRSIQTEGQVHPLLVKYCVECHGEQKQKGRLRLDTLAAAFEGGRNDGAAIVAGDPEASAVMLRIDLPRDDEEAMPPGEKKTLSLGERAELAAWIQSLAAKTAGP